MTEATLQTSTFINAKPSNAPIRGNMQIADATLADICYSPAHNAFVVLNETDLDLLQTASAPYNEAMAQLTQAQENLANNPNSASAKTNAQQASQQVQQMLKPLTKGGGASGVSWYEFHRVHRANDILYAPGSIINRADPSKNRKFYFLTGETQDSKNAFASFRNDDGTIDQAAFNDAFLKTSATIKREWNLVDESGQVPSSVIVGAFSPEIAALLNDDLKVFDKWIENVNRALTWQRDTFTEKKHRPLKR